MERSLGTETEYKGGKSFSWQDWDQLLGHVQTITGFPWAVFVEEFTQVYPDAEMVSTHKAITTEYISGILRKPPGNFVWIDPPGVLR